MQKIVDDIRVPTDDAERGVIRLDPERVGQRNIEIRIGRRRDEDGNVDLQARPTIRVEAPTVMEANGYSHELTPMEARLRNLNYMSKVFVRFDVFEDGVEKEAIESERWIHVGDLPMMVKSSGCNVIDVPDKAPWQEACAKVISDNTSDQAELYQKLLDMKA